MARTQLHIALLATFGVALAGCDSQSAVTAQPQAASPMANPLSEFDLANGCFTLLADGKPVNRDGASFSTAGGAAEQFLMRATGLGRYAFFTHDAQFLTGAVGAGGVPVLDAGVSATADPGDGSDWTFTIVEAGKFTAATGGRALAVDGSGALAMADAPALLTFEPLPASQCATFPEMPTDISDTYTGPQGGEIVGFADIHAHMAMGSDMSDGSGDRGPSAAGVMYGHAVNRFGVREAMKDCVEMHGPNGATTAELVLDTAPDLHDTVGWPTFIDWPARDSQLHQQMYYKFVERSYKAGQRLMVLHGTNIEALCDIAKKTLGDKTSDCTDMGVGMAQVAYAHDIQDYVDAQNGGPGKGWFRIVKDPTEAEAVIRAGKMAVVPGLEFSNIFKCNVTYLVSNPGDESNEVVGCTTEIIDQQIEEAWNAGVRGIFLYHDVDSALGGTGPFSAVLNLINFYGTKGWWKTYTCDDEWGGEDDQGYFYDAGTVPLAMGELGPLLANPVGALLVETAGGTIPVYPGTNQCNARGITTLGQYALEAAMKKGFVLDIDHAEISIKQAMLDEGARTTPAYPMISAHGGHGGFTNAQVLQMLRQGGIMYPGMVNGREYKWFYDKVEAIWNQMTASEKAKYPIAVGYGADQNGLANQPRPRSGDDVVPVDYDDITLFRGAGWSSRLKSLPPVKVELLTVPESGKYWNVDEVGVAHYGMIPDVVEQIRIEADGDTKYLDGFYRSAGAYLRLWQQTLKASAARPAPVRPDPATLPAYVPHPIDPTTGSP